MACTVMAYTAMAYAVMAHTVMAYIVMAYIVMAYIVMAYIVMARIPRPSQVDIVLEAQGAAEHALQQVAQKRRQQRGCYASEQVLYRRGPQNRGLHSLWPLWLWPA